MDGARVPDPQTTQRTCSTTLYTSINVPVIPNVWNTTYTGPGTGATTGRQFLLVNANPLGSFLPVQWAMRDAPLAATNTGVADNNYFGIGPGAPSESLNKTKTDPKSWAQIYDQFNQGDLVSKIYTLGQQSSRHRIVGCAVKVNLGTDTTLNRGQIEAGQFEIADTRQASLGLVPPLVENPSVNGYWYGWDTTTLVGTTKLNGQANLGMYGSRMYNCDYQTLKQSIWPSRNQNRGILRSEDGCSVRWTDSNNFQFQRTVNKCALLPELDFYTNGVDGESTTAEETAALASEDLFYKNCNSARGSATVTGGKGTINYKVRPVAAYLISGTTYAFGNEYFCADTDQRISLNGVQAVSLQSGNTTNPTSNLEAASTGLLSQFLTSAEDFDRGMYIDVTGVSPNQIINVEVQWVVEYIPKVYALDAGRHPPIDINFPAIQAMVNDPNSYPIVVKGNSFFSSLWHGIKAAAQGVGKLLKGTSTVAAMIPTPQAQAFAKFGGAGGELLTGNLQGAMQRVM